MKWYEIPQERVQYSKPENDVSLKDSTRRKPYPNSKIPELNIREEPTL